jgi:predicted phosphodiesterase
MGPLSVAVISDLHLGITSLPDVARLPDVQERLLAGLEGADAIVLLGDTLELRQGPLAPALQRARPFLEHLGEAARGREVIVVGGNHDHELVQPWLERSRIEAGELPLESRWKPAPGDGMGGWMAGCMPGTELTFAYPGVWLRPDVYALHGHYMDVHLTVPRLESIAASVLARITGRLGQCRAPADYEAVLAPIYAFTYALAQAAGSSSLDGGNRISRTVWRKVNDEDGRVGRFLLGRVTIPGAVAVMNRVGIGPFRAELTGQELRRAGLGAISDVVDGLEVDARHVLFGHTHRAGPLPSDDPGEWATPRGVRLWNPGSWIIDTAFVSERQPSNPYWPGTVIRVPDQGDPEVTNVLGDVSLPVTAAQEAERL